MALFHTVQYIEGIFLAYNFSRKKIIDTYIIIFVESKAIFRQINEITKNSFNLQLNIYYQIGTVWKFQNFPTTHIFREINL